MEHTGILSNTESNAFSNNGRPLKSWKGGANENSARESHLPKVASWVK